MRAGVVRIPTSTHAQRHTHLMLSCHLCMDEWLERYMSADELLLDKLWCLIIVVSV